MRLFAYYALHTFKNQVRKLLKTWVLIFLLICMLVGGAIGFFAAKTTDILEEDSGQAIRAEEAAGQENDGSFLSPDTEEAEVSDNQQSSEAEEEDFFASAGITPADLAELAAGLIILAVFLFMIFGADTSGSKIFLPADVPILFASPMKPQSVLMFRLTTRLGIAVVSSIYLLIQLPNLTLNLGLDIWAALALIAVWGLTIILATLTQVLLYALCSTYPAVRRFLRPAVYALLAVIAAGFLFCMAQSGGTIAVSAVRFFNAPASRFIPVWGWLKGALMYIAEGNLSSGLLCLASVLLAASVLYFLIFRIHVDFYEEAMAKSEETAALLEKAQSEKSAGLVIRRQKERGENLRRDGLNHGCGANVFFFKTLYNRFRFARLGLFTKTAVLYLAASCIAGIVCRFSESDLGVIPIVLTLSVLVFYRSMGNPLEQDTMTDYFLLIPESTRAKLFWSMMGGTVNCLLDVLLPLIAGALIVGANPVTALIWIPFMISMDFYSTNVSTFINLSVPVHAGKTIKQMVLILFIYFGLLPDIAILVMGAVNDMLTLSLIGAAFLNIALGFFFLGLSPLFLDPPGGRIRYRPTVFTGDVRAARKQFSRLGLGAFMIMLITNILQIFIGYFINRLYPDGSYPTLLSWIVSFAPMYLIAVPVGLMIMRPLPAAPPKPQQIRPGQFVTAAVICIFMMYAGNLFGLIVTSLLHLLVGIDSVNPILTYATDGSVWMKLLVIVILAPIIEECIFRRQMIDHMRIYGEKLAVVTSAVLFGLFHGNLSQMFYAAALGLVFGYVYLRTGKLRFSIGLHMFINFLGSIVAPAVLSVSASAPETGLSPQLLLLIIYILVMISAALVGLVLLCNQARRIYFDPVLQQLPGKMIIRTVFLTPGMILLIAACLVSVALNLIAL